MRIEKSAGKDKPDSKAQADRQGLLYNEMQTFLREFPQKRFKLLNVLYQCGPTSPSILAHILSRDEESFLNDIIYLGRNGFLKINNQGRLYIPWTRITITVQQVRQENYMLAGNIRNLPDWYLCICLRKYFWLKAHIKTKVSRTIPESFTCSVIPVYKK